MHLAFEARLARIKAETSHFQRKESTNNQVQPMPSDFSVYKCLRFEKMVMGFEKDTHVREQHEVRPVEWKKIR